MTPPGPHTMTAQAGAVAYAREHDASRPTFHDVVLPNSQDAEMWAYALVPLYAAPPATIPVRDLERLVDSLRSRGAEHEREYDRSAGSWRPDWEAHARAFVYELIADELTQLIKERSNG